MAGDASFRVLDAAAVHGRRRAERQLALDVLIGLAAERRSLPCKYFYDDVGSRHFRRIMQLSEYYLTSCELEILERQGEELAGRLVGQPIHLVDLGAGDGAKTM